ncbi:MAG: hypothetical protein CSB34_07065 [Desulfobulbus propionicus]|nr:MAG: hypothetical protein CSB34_07065 [Desulfobulbus propionicus]
MKSIEMAGTWWIGNLNAQQDTYSAVGVRSQDPAACPGDVSIKRNEYGVVDYNYYAQKGRQSRSDSAGLFFKTVGAFAAVFGSILFIMIHFPQVY